MLKQTAGPELRRLRGEKTLMEVAKAVGITEPALSYYETGQRNPKDHIKKRLAKYYGKSVEEIFFAD